MKSTASVAINNSTEMRDGIAFRAPHQSTFRLESEIRHSSNTGEIHHFTTLLNSGDPAALFPGTRHALVEGGGRPVRSARLFTES